MLVNYQFHSIIAKACLMTKHGSDYHPTVSKIVRVCMTLNFLLKIFALIFGRTEKKKGD
jgi:hypothetical protein